MNFRVGQKVVCVDAEAHGRYTPWPSQTAGLDGLTRGVVYTVRCIGEYRGQPILRVEEIHRPLDLDGTEPGYAPQRFRPVVERKTDISIFKKMLTPNGIPVREEVR